MADIQKYFIEFHDAIKLDDENKTLREKRDIILKKLKDKITSKAPSYDTFIQGSYAMSTGIKPVSGEYDIDVGLWFDMSKEDYKPLEAKEWVYDALKDHTKDVKIKNPCVTVTYQEDGQAAFHVDLTVYAANNSDDKIYLAKGKKYSLEENKKWEESNPKELINLIKEKFSDSEDRAQYRRIIRYLKRWKDLKFATEGHAAPTGIALTISAYEYMSPKSALVDNFANKRKYDDLGALKDFLNNLLSAFSSIVNSKGEVVERLEIKVPTPIYNDLFEKMSDNQMKELKDKIITLRDALLTAEDEVDPVEACKKLAAEFGTDFPVPTKEQTAQRSALAVTTSSSSA